VEHRQNSYRKLYNVDKSLQGALEGRNDVIGCSARQATEEEETVKYRNEE
jgi:hypothetical protein